MTFPPEEPRTQIQSQPQPVSPVGAMSVPLPASNPRITYIILGLTVVVYVLQLLSQALFNYDIPFVLGAKANENIRAGELWRFLTPMLLHGSIMHIGFNMYALLSFGSGLERHYGRGRFLSLYILSGFAGSVFSFMFNDAYSIGASGAIFGLIGAEGIFLYQNRKLFGNQVRSAINNIVFIVAINLFLGLSPGIDNWGHIGGLVGGLIFAWFAGPRWNVIGIFPNYHLADQREFRDVILGAAVVIIIFCALVWLGF